MFTNLKNFILSEKAKGIIAIVAAVVMWFTPDHIDRIIELCLLCLAAIGVSKLVLKRDEE
jgi:hypothetical protein